MNVGKINNQYVGINDKGEVFTSEFWHIFSRRLKRECDASAFSTKVDSRENREGANAPQGGGSGKPGFPPIG